jgi:hypothetical protein
MEDFFMPDEVGVTAGQDALRSVWLLALNLIGFLKSGAVENLLDGLGLSRVHRGRPAAPDGGDHCILYHGRAKAALLPETRSALGIHAGADSSSWSSVPLCITRAWILTARCSVFRT